MKSKIEITENQKRMLDDYLNTHDLTNGIKPVRIKEILRTNNGMMNYFERNNNDYVERRNPLIVIIGDSVTSGSFEEIDTTKLLIAQDLEDCYVEKFKHMLHDSLNLSSLNVINSGIAGDNMFGMYKRRYQDIFDYKPDLVIINGSLNWSSKHGNNSKFNYYLNLLVDELKEKNIETILMTSNICTNDTTHIERIEMIRETALSKSVPLVDIYKMFTDCFEEKDYESLLTNKINHPTPYIHTIMAKALMQIFK